MTKKSKFCEPLASSVAAGHSIKESAKLCGCSESWAYSMSCTAEFRNRVASIRSEITSSTVGILTQAATKAAQTLLELLGKENEPPVRLNAAKAILGQLAGITELGELRERIDRLEGTPRS